MFWAPSASVDAAGTSALAATTGRAFLLLLGLLCQDRCRGGNVQMCSRLDLVTVWTVSVLMMFPRCGHLQVLTVEPNWAAFFTGESMTLRCDMREGKPSDWYYRLMKDQGEYYWDRTDQTFFFQYLTTGIAGQYYCSGFHKKTTVTKESNRVSLTVSDRNLILQHPAIVLYRGETVPLRCRYRFQTDMTTATFYKDGALIATDPNQRKLMSENVAEISLQLLSDSSYTCRFGSEESTPIRLKVDQSRPKAQLRKGESPAGGNVTLTCSVMSPSPGWMFFWYRGKKKNDSLTTQDINFLNNNIISTSQQGVYWCRGGRGNPTYYTEYSSPIVTSRAVVLLQPSWPQLYEGEAVTLRCEIEGGEDFEWEYLWSVPNVQVADVRSHEYRISYTTGANAGSYQCQGRMKNEIASTTWSKALRLTVSNTKLRPVLTVSPSWLSPGDSVTLRCSLQDPYKGWRFYWYKAIPNLTINSYDMEPLPGSSNGTEESHFIVQGQTQTVGFACKAGRGNPLKFTFISNIKFVWSGDLQPAVSLSVSPDQAQHFITDGKSLSLSCAGDSDAWTVNRFSSSGFLTRCATWGSMIGPTCSVIGTYFSDGVYWCESATGQFSNAVNITGSYDSAIVVFPAHPVTQGQPVTLRCKMETELKPSVIYFYKNGKIIQNDTRREFVIPAASKSDEGFYKCGKSSMQRLPSRTSPESWMSVKQVASHAPISTSPFPVWLTVGLVCGITVVVLLLLFLGRYAKSKEMCTARSPNTHQSSAADPKINQGDAPRPETPPLNDESTEVTYSLVFLKKAAEGGTTEKPEESAVYSNVVLQPTAGNLQPATENETVYAEVRKKL